MNDPGSNDDRFLVHFLLKVIIFRKIGESGIFLLEIGRKGGFFDLGKWGLLSQAIKLGREKGGCEWTVLSRCIR